MHRRNWDTLLTLKNGNGTFSLLNHFLLLKESVLKATARSRSAEHTACSKNMFVAIWDSLARSVQSTVLVHKKQFKQDGPLLLYYVLRKYTGEQKNILCQTLRTFDSLSDIFKSSYRYDVDRFATYVYTLEEKLRECEGKDDLYHEKVYEALITTHVDDFNRELTVWRSGVLLKQDKYTCNALLLKAREHYNNLTV